MKQLVMTQMQGQQHIKDILSAVKKHDLYRANCIGLVPTENLLSPTAQATMMSDLSHRYLFQNPQWRYVGGQHLSRIEDTAKELANTVFGSGYANVRALSGENCTNIMLHALVRPGKVFYHVAMEDGGHFAAKTIVETIGAQRFTLPYDRENASIDIDRCREAFRENPPDVIYLDASLMLFPHPVRELREIAPDAIIAYDGSQVLGLIAGKQFQDPLREGADFLSGSCHKSLPGPQKGLIATNRLDRVQDIENAIFPGLVSNFHLHHVAALAVTLAETLDFGETYAEQTIRNAQAFGRALDELGFKVEGKARGFSESHQVWIDIRDVCTPDEAVDLLHEANLIANVNLIPTIGSKGLRLGTPEVTRLGMTEEHMERIAGFMHDVLIARESPETVRQEVVRMATAFSTPQFCY